MQQQQNSPGGPRQMAPRSQALRASALAAEQNAGAFGFHYSLDTKGHLVIVPAADGYLFVKSGDGKILFPRKQIAAAITTDIALPDAVNSVTITFTREESAAETKPTPRPESSGAVEGSDNLAIEVKIKSN